MFLDSAIYPVRPNPLLLRGWPWVSLPSGCIWTHLGTFKLLWEPGATPQPGGCHSLEQEGVGRASMPM